MTSFATYFAGILAGLRSLALRTALPDRAASEMLFAVSAYLLRATARLARLHASWQAGKLPAPAPARPAVARPAAAAPRANPRPRIVRRKAWLRQVLGADAGNFGSQIVHMLLRPDAPAFLAAAPQAGRILRPLLHLLGTEIPAELALPRRAPKPRPSPRPAPSPEPHPGKYTPRAMRRYSPGRIPEPRHFRKTT